MIKARHMGGDPVQIQTRKNASLHVLTVTALFAIITWAHGSSSFRVVREPNSLQAAVSLCTSRLCSAPTASRGCLECDILDMLSPSSSGSYAEAIDWSLKGPCSIPRNVGNSSSIISNLLEYKDRCTGSRCSVWLAFIGDSQLRGPFDHMIRVLLGSEWPAHKPTYENATYHTDRRVCCVSNQPKQPRDKSDVHKTLNCTVTLAFDTPAYARSYLRERVDRNSTRFCLTWQWSRMAEASLREDLANYTGINDNGTIISQDAAVAPQMVVVNPGLHPIFVAQKEADYVNDVNLLLSQMRNIATTQLRMSLVPTRFVFHEITAVIDAQVTMFKVRLVNQTMALRFNAALTACLNDAINTKGAHQWLRVLPAQRLTYFGRQRGLLSPQGDGIHYNGGYDNIVSQLDLYFMRASAASEFCQASQVA